MRICVLLKQVPAKSVPTDETSGILLRNQAGGKLNPWDYYALEAALRMRDACGGEITAITMGPPSAKQVLTEAFSYGIDTGILLEDTAFRGADVYATAYALKGAISLFPPFDAIFCGQQSTDGDTAQLPPSLAAQVHLPMIAWVKSMHCSSEKPCSFTQELSFGTQEICLTTPAVLSVGAGIGKVRMPSLKDKLKAKSKEIFVLHLADLQDKDEQHYGLFASPTRVVHTTTAQVTPKAACQELSAKEASLLILKAVKAAKEAN